MNILFCIGEILLTTIFLLVLKKVNIVILITFFIGELKVQKWVFYLYVNLCDIPHQIETLLTSINIYFAIGRRQLTSRFMDPFPFGLQCYPLLDELTREANLPAHSNIILNLYKPLYLIE